MHVYKQVEHHDSLIFLASHIVKVKTFAVKCEEKISMSKVPDMDRKDSRPADVTAPSSLRQEPPLSRSEGIGDAINSPVKTEETEVRENNVDYKAIIWEVYNGASAAANAFHAISWWKKILYGFLIFTVGSYFGYWSFQFSPSVYLSWREMFTVMTGIQGISIVLAITYALLKSEAVKNFVKAWTEGTPVGTAVYENLGPEFEKMVFKAPKYLVRLLPAQFQILFTIGNYILKAFELCGLDVVGNFLWNCVCKCCRFAAVIYSIVLSVYTGGVVLFSNPLTVIASLIALYLSSKYNSQMREFERDGFVLFKNVLYNCCHALVWYYLASFLASPVLYFLY